MKKSLIFFSLLLFHNLILFPQTWQWANSGRGAGQDYGTAITTDENGNCYATGYFGEPIIVFGNDTLINTSGSDNFYLVKFNPLGNVLWSKTASCQVQSYGTDVKTDKHGNCYVSGWWGNSSNIIFGSDTLSGDSGSNHIFIVKYDSSGNVIWVKCSSGDLAYDENRYNRMNLDSDDNIIITGPFGWHLNSIINFGDTILTNNGSNGWDIFIARYNSSGNFVWAKKVGGNADDISNGIISDDIGNVYITGNFDSDSISFDNTIIHNLDGNQKMFVAKYDSSGNVLWAKSCGRYAAFYANDIGVDNNRNIYITGYVLSSNYAAFDTTVYTISGSEDFFIVKFDNSANMVWAKTSGGMGAEEAYGISTDLEGNSYVTGLFNNIMILGSTPLISIGSNDVFVAKYDSSGNIVGAEKAGGTEVDIGKGISIDAYGNSYITGYFFSPYMYLGNITLSNCDTISTPSEVFVAKLGTITGIPESKNNIDGIIIYPNPSYGNVQVANNKYLFKKISIYNLLGEKIYEKTINDFNTNINLNVPNGVYCIQLICQEGIISKKIVIQK